MTEQTPAVSEERGYRKALRGIVVSDKMDKTIVVEVEDRKKHSLYGKVLKTSRRTTRTTPPAWATASASPRPARCPPPSGGVWWRSSSAPSDRPGPLRAGDAEGRPVHWHGAALCVRL